MKAEPYLAPHPWDSIGKPPEPGKPYVEPEPEPVAKATANHFGFTDATGKHIDFEVGVRAAARALADEPFAIEDLIRDSMSPDDILEWLIYPDTGEFADDVS